MCCEGMEVMMLNSDEALRRRGVPRGRIFRSL